MIPPFFLFLDLSCCREKELAKKYYDKLFKEYCIADLSRFKENKVGNRTSKDINCNSETAKMEPMGFFKLLLWSGGEMIN